MAIYAGTSIDVARCLRMRILSSMVLPSGTGVMSERPKSFLNLSLLTAVTILFVVLGDIDLIWDLYDKVLEYFNG